MKWKRWAVSLLVVIGMLFAAVSVNVVRASPLRQDESEDVEFTGTVVSFDEDAGVLVVEVEEDGGTTLYTVEVSEDFDFDGMAVGSVVEVEGVFDEDGTVVADKVTDESEVDEEDEEGEEEEGAEENFFCANPDFSHPAGAALAERYDADYEQVMGWFCEDGLGFGQIMHGLYTAAMLDETAETYLERRLAGEGWGQIWQSLDVVGRGRENENGPPEHAGPPEDAGKPEHTGKPEHAGPPDHAGPPEHAGPPDHANGRGRP